MAIDDDDSSLNNSSGINSARNDNETEARESIAKRNQLSTWFDQYKKWNTMAPLAKGINGPLKLRDRSEPFCIVLNTIRSIKIPDPVLNNIKSSQLLVDTTSNIVKSNFATIGIRLTFYSLAAKSFYGSTWSSKPHPLRISKKKVFYLLN